MALACMCRPVPYLPGLARAQLVQVLHDQQSELNEHAEPWQTGSGVLRLLSADWSKLMPSCLYSGCTVQSLVAAGQKLLGDLKKIREVRAVILSNKEMTGTMIVAVQGICTCLSEDSQGARAL